MKIVALAHKLLALRLFARQEHITSKAEIIKWWELRRIPFNIAVGVTGVVTCAIIAGVDAIAESRFGEPLDFPNSPIGAILGIIGYAIAANVCFSCGWLTEIAVRKIWQEHAGKFAQISFSLGLLFSMLFTLVPAAFFVVLLVIRLLEH
jgi:hypothetical protein